jgi:hypothetical protein
MNRQLTALKSSLPQLIDISYPLSYLARFEPRSSTSMTFELTWKMLLHVDRWWVRRNIRGKIDSVYWVSWLKAFLSYLHGFGHVPQEISHLASLVRACSNIYARNIHVNTENSGRATVIEFYVLRNLFLEKLTGKQEYWSEFDLVD